MGDSRKPLLLTDVTLRDGLQAESKQLSTPQKLELFAKLDACGYSRLEITSFVSPKWIPQLADSREFCEAIFAKPRRTQELMAFVPNEKGLERLLPFPISWVSTFVAASETFNQKNINATIAETLKSQKTLVQRAHREKRKIRIYVSTAFGCPYEGAIPTPTLFKLLKKVAELSPDEIALSDTIGVATPLQMRPILERFSKIFPLSRTALHLHNTYDLALSNIQVGLDCGVRGFDGSTGGIGGCPYAKGATGNLAMEEILYLLYRERRWKEFRLQPIREVFAFLRDNCELTLHSGLAEILKKGGALYGIH